MKVFLGCSKESLDLVRLVEVWLEELNIQPLPWDEPGLFIPGSSTLHRLIEIANEVDGAIFIFSGDDKVWYRNDSNMHPRDSMLMEYGIFVGVLGVQRSIILKVKKTNTTSDLQGISYIDVSESNRSRGKYEIKLWCERIIKKNTENLTKYIVNTTIQNNHLLFEEFKKDIIKNFNKYRNSINATTLEEIKLIEDAYFDVNLYPSYLKSKMKEYLLFYEYFGSILKTVTKEEFELNELDYFALGMAAYLEGKLEEAKSFFEYSLKINSKNYLTYYRLGGIYFLLNTFDKAIDCFDTAINLNPDFALSYFNIGVIFVKMKKYEYASVSFKKVLDIDNYNLLAYNNLAGVHIIQKQYTEAQEILDKLLSLDQTYSKAYYNKACIFSELKNKDQALFFLKKAITFEPELITLASKDTSFEWLSNDSDFLDYLNSKL